MSENAAPRPTVFEKDEEIGRLTARLAEMAALAEGMVADGTRALLGADVGLRSEVMARDERLDRFDLELEAETILAVARIQPEGTHLRTLEALLKIANCVDRIGRLGYDLAAALSSAPLPDGELLDEVRAMDGAAREMVVGAVGAFVNRDEAAARAVLARDDQVDAMNRDLQARIIRRLHDGGPSVDRLAYLLLASRHLERVADNACKIAEKAVYAVTGQRRSEYFPPRKPRPGFGP